jgi:hypothetical protein
MKRMTALVPISLFLCCCSALVAEEKTGLVVHEWGTFTSLQDEKGNAVGGINTDDEPLPRFTYNLAPAVLPNEDVEGAPRCHPDVTMRLETPVIYFHPRGQWSAPVNVHVDFLGGWLTQFYPNAEHPKLPAGMRRLSGDTTSSLEWQKIELGGNGDGPKTSSHVWTAPRAVEAALVTTPAGEKERFLFYRGVGHLDSPVRVERHGKELQLNGQPGMGSANGAPLRELWLAEFRPGGKCAFHKVPALTLGSPSDAGAVAVAGEFSDDEFSTENLSKLKHEMHTALVDNGLYADEALAVLNTWEASYFQSGGQRLLYMVPKEWVARCLPLQISAECEVSRVMVGRIELISPRQRELLNRLSVAPKVEDYAALGRFRSALLLHEQAVRPTPALKAFISANVQSISLPSYQVAGKCAPPPMPKGKE